ncbi:MAG TPA: hypothetical protein VGZ69_02190 [Candidatus Rhabdochlamydia sp.]|jgi:hypothetical protein|nr:hypothetical protein [Candidatus Rhabdochlamydia sp.]
MSSIVTIMSLTSYNPYKEAISMGLAKVGPYLIDKLTLEPINVVSKIDRIRETLFGIRTQFLLFTQKNSLTKYTWVFLKSIPNSLVISRGFALSFYLMTRMHGVEFIKDDVLMNLS